MKASSPKSKPETQQANQERKRPISRDGLSAEAAASRASVFVDNRPEAIAHQKLQALADQSPQVQRLAQLQAMVNNSPRVKAQARLQAMIDNNPRQVAQRKQLQRIFGPTIQRQEGMDEEELQMQAEPGTIRRQNLEDEKLLQEDKLLQGAFATSDTPTQFRGDTGHQENRPGLPDNLKAGIESLSGMFMDDVTVHYNSSKPAQLNALAYTQGTDIHVGPVQEKHLPYEGWHVVQQKPGRVKPTIQAQGVTINDDGLEHEADVMGAKAMQMRRSDPTVNEVIAQAAMVVQREGETTEASEVPSSHVGASGEKVRLNFLSTRPPPALATNRAIIDSRVDFVSIPVAAPRQLATSLRVKATQGPTIQRVPTLQDDGTYIDPDVPGIVLEWIGESTDGHKKLFRVQGADLRLVYHVGSGVRAAGYDVEGGGPIDPDGILARAGGDAPPPPAPGAGAVVAEPEQKRQRLEPIEESAEEPGARTGPLNQLLSDEILATIFGFAAGLDHFMGARFAGEPGELGRIRQVCRLWNQIVRLTAGPLGYHIGGVLTLERLVPRREQEEGVLAPLTFGEMYGIHDIAESIAEQYPLNNHLFVSIGNSPALIMEYLRQSAGAAVEHLPMSAVSGLETAEGRPRSDERSNFYDYVDATLDRAFRDTNRTIVIVDIVVSGSGLATAAVFLERYFRHFGNPREIQMLALNERLREGLLTSSERPSHLPLERIRPLPPGGREATQVQNAIVACRFKSTLLLRLFERHDFAQILRGELRVGRVSPAHYQRLLEIIKLIRRITKG